MAVVGRVARTHGIKGHVYVNPDTDFLEERFAVGAVLNVGRSGDDWRPMSVTAVRFHQGRPVIALSGIADMNAAVALNGAELRVPLTELAELPDGTFYRHDLVGCQVETVDGTVVGTVTHVDGDAGEHRLVVTGTDGTEILVPLVEAICPSIDPLHRRIVIAPPEGLLELNARAGKPVG